MLTSEVIQARSDSPQISDNPDGLDGLLEIPCRVNGLNAMALERARIDADADKVVRRLARSGHKAYLVGGCVRDLLLQRTPKDFDVATSATPNEIRALFRNCRIIGRRFRLAHIFFGPKIIETSTFRANPRDGDEGELLIRRDNVFGSADEDAHRRDFTINGLFYDVDSEQVIDYVGGETDLQAKLIRTIGDANIRFREDPVRMLRAIKFAARLGFQFEPKTYAALLRHREEIRKCSPARVLEEVYRLLRGGAAVRSMELLLQTGVGAVLSPHLAALFADEGALWDSQTLPAVRFSGDEPYGNPMGTPFQDPVGNLLEDAMGDSPEDPMSGSMDEEEAQWLATWAEDFANTSAPAMDANSSKDRSELAEGRQRAWRTLAIFDELAIQQHDLSNPLLLSALIKPFVTDDAGHSDGRPRDASAKTGEIAHPLVEDLRVSRRDVERLRQILQAQRRMAQWRRRRGRPQTLVRREYFDDALTLYEISARVEGRSLDDIEYWYQVRDDERGEGDDSMRKRRRRRGGRRRRRGEGDDVSAAISG